ncbi:MAG TPA: DNA methyltransferase, partial [Victivallales bacterium]|nr:DNA methyltransferase [Victivallales bacterium]
MLEFNTIHNINCLEGLKLLPDNSIDSIVTDPPYELGFMGKSWDSTGIAYNIELWKECLRVLKHGGHLLAFGGTRTYHRMACAIEDAGFEIRDQIQWIYGSGFPKSMNISKAIDKKLGAEREVIGIGKGAGKNPKGLKYDDDKQSGGHLKNEYDLTIPKTTEAKQWEGWGTALKPANEPIVVARKPLSEKTVAENVLKWGTGGINIDDCRVEYDMTDTNPATNPLYREKNGYKTNYRIDSNPSAYTLKKQEGTMNINNQGRFPANVILDEEAGKMLDEQSGILKSGALKPYQENHQNASSYKM